MPQSNPSPEYTITLSEGTYDVILRCVQRVAETAAKADTVATTYQELSTELRHALDLALNLQSQLLGQLLRSNQHDGNVRLFPDGPEGIFFRYDSGYHGAMLLHNADTPHAAWSVHT